MTISLDALKADEALLRRELEAGGAVFRGKTCKCIFHEDGTASAGIYLHDGHWHFKCHGCGFFGTFLDVRARLNKRTPAEELRSMNDANASRAPRPQEPSPKLFPTLEAIAQSLPNVEDVYKDLYTDPETGRAIFAVVRWRNRDGKKAFTQCSATLGGWVMKAPEGKLPIANRRAIKGADVVVVVEGEKCIRWLAKLGIVATSSPGGALKGSNADWSPMAGKIVILWPDLDTPDDNYPEGKGAEHMRQVQKLLQQLAPAPKLLWFDPAPCDLPAKGDAADLVERYLKEFSIEESKALVDDLLADAKAVGIVGEYAKEIEATIAGQRRNIPFPWRTLTAYARALMPGNVLCVCGDAGSGKSLFVSNCIVEWQACIGLKMAIYHLEDDRNYHLRRIHAQLARTASITDNEWVERNGEFMRESIKFHESDLEAVGRCIWEATDEEVSLEMLGTWMEERAKAGAEILVIDPVTAAQSSRPWIADLKFITKAKLIGRRYGCRVIFVTHPRTGTKAGKASHNDMAGGAAYPRFSHSVLWLERNDVEAQYTVKTHSDSPPEYLTPNRILTIAKARNGPGSGKKIAFFFNPSTLTFDELGHIMRETTEAA